MERPLPPPTFIRQHGTPRHLDPHETYDLLSSFLLSQTSKAHYAPSTQTAQLERLADVIGIQIGAVDPSEAEEHERERERMEQEESERVRKAREEALGVAESEAGEMVKEEQEQVVEQQDPEEMDDEEDEVDELDSEEEGAGLPANEKGDEEAEDEDEDVDMK